MMAERKAKALITLPHSARFDTQRFELIEATSRSLSGVYFGDKTNNRFEVRIEFEDGTTEWFSVLAAQPYSGGTLELAGKNCSFNIGLEKNFRSVGFEFKGAPSLDFTFSIEPGFKQKAHSSRDNRSDVLLFDVSDLVYYIGHHDNLTGIQRVQACVLMGLIQACPKQARKYISYNNRVGDFLIVESEYFESLLQDLSRPIAARVVKYDPMDARLGILPNSKPLATHLSVRQSERLVVYLLGAAWVNRDYFHRILDLKRAYEAIFCMTVHDLIPIFARETCDQGTATVFEEFLRKSLLFTDHYFTVSEYTALDMHRFATSIGRKNVPISVTENGHSFDEFFPFQGAHARSPITSDYVLFVSTIEGRKNHSYIFDVWAELSKSIKKLPVLVCVGRLGWRAESFLEKMLVSGNLNNKIRVMSEISDAQLEALYQNCLFTVYPSIYEGWGLPIGESLSKGRLSVISRRSSIPEVAGDFGIYIDIDSVHDGAEKIHQLITDVAYRERLEARLRSDFVPRTWKEVAKNLVGYVTKIPRSTTEAFPQASLGREYKLSQLPPRNFSALGYAMIAEVEGARKAAITGYINRDEDLLNSQAMRVGPSWCSPEDWGTWSRYPDCEKLFYLKPATPINEIVIYEKLRVVGLLVGHTLRAIVNDGPAQEFRVEAERFMIRIGGPVHIEADGIAEIRINYQLKGPADVLAALEKVDGRRLGLGFESMLIVDDSDLVSRITMLERMLFGGLVNRVVTQGAGTATRAIGSQGGAQKTGEGGRSLLVRSQAGLNMVDAGDQRSLNAPRIETGERIYVKSEAVTRSLESAEHLLGRGWFPLEPSGVWSNGHEATLQFKLGETAEPAFIVGLELRCLATRSKPINVSVAINNVFLGAENFRDGEFHFVNFVVDGNICPPDRAFVLLIHCDRAVSPAEIGVESDTRELGVQVRSLIVDPLYTLSLDRVYAVTEKSEIIGALAHGWYPAEPFGVWSKEEGGRIIAAVDLPVDHSQRSVRIVASARIFGPASSSSPVRIDILVQGQVSGTWVFEDDAIVSMVAIVPLLKLGSRSLLDLRLVRRGVVPSPADLGGSEDKRKLGVLLSQMSFENVNFSNASEHSAIEIDMKLDDKLASDSAVVP